jgi:hypothetical protein
MKTIVEIRNAKCGFIPKNLLDFGSGDAGVLQLPGPLRL